MPVFAPVGYWFVTTVTPELALVTGVMMVWFAMLPDIDHRLPLVDHRGVTHSLLFAFLIGSLFGAAGLVLDGTVSISKINLGVYGFLFGTLTVGAHLVRDILTAAGVPLLWPLSRNYSRLFHSSAKHVDHKTVNKPGQRYSSEI
jgi:inner membrane protein